MTALLCIDTATNRVRRYAPRRSGGRVIVTDEVRILSGEPDFDVVLCKQQMEQLRLGEPIVYAVLNPEPEAA